MKPTRIIIPTEEFKKYPRRANIDGPTFIWEQNDTVCIISLDGRRFIGTMKALQKMVDEGSFTIEEID